ncbi:hypothetical protein [Embleya sp. NPDC005575]|uniref:hypothetical protein n=1 Tax=Embleya sp. NPDC005575 TaxID=3156892 RepID=UPI0033AEE6CD
MPRSIALGMLLFMVESAVHHDSDRLDHEQVRAGYLSGILSALQDLPEKDRTDASGGVWVALLRERAHRSALDLRTTEAPLPPDVYSLGPLAPMLLDAVSEVLRGTLESPQDPEDMPEALRTSLRVLRKQLQEARQHVEDGRKTLKKLGVEP